MKFDLKQLWPDWSIVRLIGEGSYGKVYEIVRNNFGIEEHSALKVISIPSSQAELQSMRNDGMDDKSATEYFRGLVEEFTQEIALMSKLKGNINIVGYEDYAVIEHKESIGWDIVIRMELLTDLPSFLRKNSFSTKDVLKLAIDLCNALEICHRQRIIHRDIKPDNIFLSENGDFKLGDFGVARTIEKTVSGLSKKGTYTYMAPEVYKSENYGTDVDLYSLGIVMYKLLNNNREPFLPPAPQLIKYSDKNDALVRRMSGENIPVLDDVDEEINKIILKACAFSSKDRYNSPTQMKTDLLTVYNSHREFDENILSTEDIVNSKTHSSPTNEPSNVKEEQEEKTMSAFADIPANDFSQGFATDGKNNEVFVFQDGPGNAVNNDNNSETLSSNGDNNIGTLVLGWIGFGVWFVIMLATLPYLVLQTIAVLVSMICLSINKNQKTYSIVMLIAAVLSLNVINIIASIMFLKKCKNNSEG